MQYEHRQRFSVLILFEDPLKLHNLIVIHCTSLPSKNRVKPKQANRYPNNLLISFIIDFDRGDYFLSISENHIEVLIISLDSSSKPETMLSFTGGKKKEYSNLRLKFFRDFLL